MKKIRAGLLWGILAGIADVIPMVILKLPPDADISAFLLWVTAGFFIATTELKIHPVLKGLLIAFLLLMPSAILIGWKEPASLLPVGVMTAILGSALGFAIEKTVTKTLKT